MRMAGAANQACGKPSKLQAQTLPGTSKRRGTYLEATSLDLGGNDLLFAVD